MEFRFLNGRRSLVGSDELSEVSQEEFKNKIVAGSVAITLVNSLIMACLECCPHLYDGLELVSMPYFGNPYRGARRKAFSYFQAITF